MPIRFRVYPVARLVTYTAEGPVTDEQAREFLDAVLADRRFRRGFDFLGDGCGTPDAAYPDALARGVLERRGRLGPCRWAVVAGPGALGVRAERARACGVEVAPFAGWSEGLSWLGQAADGRPGAADPERTALFAAS